MKTRNGFVSNSSSSSFLIVGLPVEKEQIKELTLAELSEICQGIEGLTSYTKKICCGKQLATNFCPICGKPIDEVPEIADMDKLFTNLVREYPPNKIGFFDTPENGIYYCCSFNGKISKLLDHRHKFIKAAQYLYSDFPNDESIENMLIWLDENLSVVGGEYYC